MLYIYSIILILILVSGYLYSKFKANKKIIINNKINYSFGNNQSIYATSGFNDINDSEYAAKISLRIITKNTIYKYVSRWSLIEINTNMTDIKLNKHNNFLDLYTNYNERPKHLLYMYDYNINMNEIPTKENIKNIFECNIFKQYNTLPKEFKFDANNDNKLCYKYFEKLFGNPDKKIISIYIHGDHSTGKTHFIKNIYSIIHKLTDKNIFINYLSSYYFDIKYIFDYRYRDIIVLYLPYDIENKNHNEVLIQEICKRKNSVTSKIILLIEGYSEDEYNLEKSNYDIRVKTRNLTIKEIEIFAEYYYNSNIKSNLTLDSTLNIDYKFTPQFISDLLIKNDNIIDFYKCVKKL